MSQAQREGLEVGAGWSTEESPPDQASLSADPPSVTSVEYMSSLQEALLALPRSLDYSAGTSVGIRWLAGAELWLKALERRMSPQGGLRDALSEFRGYVSTQLGLLLARGGDHAVCTLDWSRRVASLREAVERFWPVGVAKKSQKCRSSRCGTWTLLHGLATVNV